MALRVVYAVQSRCLMQMLFLNWLFRIYLYSLNSNDYRSTGTYVMLLFHYIRWRIEWFKNYQNKKYSQFYWPVTNTFIKQFRFLAAMTLVQKLVDTNNFVYINKRKNSLQAIQKRKEKKLKTWEVQWIKQNLRTKRDEDEDIIDGNEKFEIKMKAFGIIEFKGATKRAKSRVSLLVRK